MTDATRSPREPDDRDPLDLPELLELQEARVVVAVDPEEARRQVPRQLPEELLGQVLQARRKGPLRPPS